MEHHLAEKKAETLYMYIQTFIFYIATFYYQSVKQFMEETVVYAYKILLLTFTAVAFFPRRYRGRSWQTSSFM